MPNPEIGGVEVYASLAETDAYMENAFHADAWRASTDELKERAIVTATRIFNRQRWLGEKTDPAQELAWPRTGTGLAGVSDTVIPQDIIYGMMELALALVDGSEVQTEQNTSQKIASLSAGSVSISFFRGAEGAVLRWPLIIWELIRDYLEGSASGIGGIIVSGVDGESVTRNDFGFTGPS